MKRFWGALSAALLALSVAPTASASTAVTAAEASTPPPGTNLQVLNWNMCGVERWGGCAATGTPAQKIDVVKGYVKTHYVQAALIQEVCESTLTSLVDGLNNDPAIQPGWTANFVPYMYSSNGVRWASPCTVVDGKNVGRAGTAIVIKAGLADPVNHAFPGPLTGLNPPFQCATATYFGVRLCTAHVSTKPTAAGEKDYRAEQLAEIKKVVTQHPKVSVSGDFNTLPPDWPGSTPATWPVDFYSGGEGTPGYRECDQEGTARTGRSTTDGGWKIDYLFSSEQRRWCLVADTAYSDHHVLIESVMITPPAS